MKLTNLSLAIMVAVGVSACGGSGNDNSNKPADPPKPSTPEQPKQPEQPQQPQAPDSQKTVDPTGTQVVDNKELSKETTVGTLNYIRRESSQYDRAFNPSKKASASPLLGEELNKQNPKLTNIVLARQHLNRTDGVAVQAQFAGMDNPEPLDREGNVNYDSVVENRGGLSLQEENFKNVDVLSQLYQKGNEDLGKKDKQSNNSDVLGLHVDNLSDKISNNVDDKNKIHREYITNTYKEDFGTASTDPKKDHSIDAVGHFPYVTYENGVYKRTAPIAVDGNRGGLVGTDSLKGIPGQSVTGRYLHTNGNPDRTLVDGSEVGKDFKDHDDAQIGVYRLVEYKDNAGNDVKRYYTISDAKTVTAIIDPYAVTRVLKEKLQDGKTDVDDRTDPRTADFRKVTSKDVEGNKDVYMYRGSSLWKKPSDFSKQAVTPEFADKYGTKYGKNLVWWTTPETAFENHFTRGSDNPSADDMPTDGNTATNGLIRIGGGLSTLGQELNYDKKEGKWEDHHKTTTRIFGRYHLAYAGTAEKNKGVNPVAMNSYSGAKSFAAEYVSKNGGPYRNPTAAQAAVRGTAADEPGETTRYSLGAIPMTLKNVQYGRVTTQLDLDAGEKGYTDNFIRNPYAKKGDEDSVDNYFYRGTNATTIEQMAALPSDQKAVYKGHALMYGIDNNYHASGGRNLPNAFAGTTDGLGLGNFVEARVDFGKKRVLGEVYNEWLLDPSKASTTRDKLVRFQGNISGNTVIGTADRTYIEGDDCATFKASFFGEKAEEMGGSFNSVKDSQKYGDAYGQNDWGGVFGATKGDNNTFQGDDGSNLYGGQQP